jgi:serine O-acetyltransferase
MVVQVIVEDAVADMQAVLDRDPACLGFLQVLLFFKGFQAIQAYRIAHYLWHHGRRSLAYALQSRISQQFDVDIHPAAYIGRGVMMDHATGVVIGETAVIGDNVSMLHRVTIGGSGVNAGIRHPTIGHGVLLGAGTTVLGPIHVGHSTKIGAGSVVVHDLPEKAVAVGVPARVIRQDKKLEPCKDMDQSGDYVLDFII